MESQDFSARMIVKDRNALQLYSFQTPNGTKVASMLEEIIELKELKEDASELYEPHAVNIRLGENRTEWYSRCFLNQKIPGLVDHHAGNDRQQTVHIFESGAILMYLAEKYKVLLPECPCLRVEVINWLFWGSSSFSNQVKLFGFYSKYCSHALPYCQERYVREVHRLLSVLNGQLSHQKHWVVGDAYTIADVAIWPWVHALFEIYDNAGEKIFNLAMLYPLVFQWYRRALERPASKRSLEVCAFQMDST